ncbi:MAG TPA: hypothetical protein VHD32_16280 [Candidatus Didemnitutus sp.]|nr:hypothetical protein [Candidatus Didemnitutus sp.]
MSVEAISSLSPSAAGSATLLYRSASLPSNLQSAAFVDSPSQIRSLIFQLELDEDNSASGVSSSQALQDIFYLREAQAQQARSATPRQPEHSAMPVASTYFPSIPAGTILTARA